MFSGSIRGAAYRGALLFALLLLWVLPAQGQDLLAQFEDRVETFMLENGLQFVVVERREAPIVSFHTYADVGAVDEPMGQSGMAHMFEHMAFKGTTSLGTEDIEAEMAALERVEEIYQELRRERNRGHRADEARIEQLEAEFEEAQEYALEYADEGAYDQLLEREGVSGLNAYTSADATGYLYSLPANRLELFFATESDRFHNPVQREFYTERDVVMEERRQRTESNPQGRLLEEFVSTAFKAHPYGIPVIGHRSDIANYTRTDSENFFETFYGPGNLTIGIAGDVDAGEVRELAEKYFARLEERPEPPPVVTEEPEQLGERRVTIVEDSQPLVLMGFHRPSMFHEDAAVYDVMQDILSVGRTSRMYQALVREDKALGAQVIPSFPGQKHPSLFTVFGVPSQDVSPDSLEQAIFDELELLIEEGVTEEELERAKTRARTSLVRGLNSNRGLAQHLSRMQALHGDWREAFRQVDAIEAVTAEDVQRVARETFTESNRTVAMIRTRDN